MYNPFFFQGTKTYAFEIWEQLEGRAPDVLVVPVGNGTLVLGPYYGFQELLAAGLIKTMPRILAVQTEISVTSYFFSVTGTAQICKASAARVSSQRTR